MPYDEYGDWYENDPELEPCKWKKGDKAYLISLDYTREWIASVGSSFGLDYLGKQWKVTNIEACTWGGYYQVDIVNGSYHNGRVSLSVHENDLSLKNTFTPPPPLPDYMQNALKMDKEYGHGYSCHYLLFIDNDKSKSKRIKHMSKQYKRLEDSILGTPDPCRCCYKRCVNTKECAAYQKYRKRVRNPKLVKGLVNDNNACWAALKRMWRTIYKEHGQHPDRLWAKLTKQSLAYPKDVDNYNFEEICKFFKYMVKGRVLPYYLKTPTIDDYGKDVILEFDVSKVGINRLFWYLCVVRNPCEQPTVVRLTNHFIEEGNLDPLMAYVLGHVFYKGWNGGHAILHDLAFMRDMSIGNTYDIYPNMKAIVDYTVRVHRFLTRKTEPYISESSTIYNWSLQNTTTNTPIRKKPEVPTVSQIQQFSIKERKLIKEVS
jgi:hypothetical protein